MDKEKKVWIVGGVLIAAGTLYLAYKQYKQSQANAASSAASNDALLQALMSQPLTNGYAAQPSGYSGPSASTGNSAFQNVLTSILGSGSSSSDTGSTSTTSTGTSTSTAASAGPIQWPVSTRTVNNTIGGGYAPIQPIGPEPVKFGISSPSPILTQQPILTIKSPNFVTEPVPGMIQ